jgi:group I intron endonuclease
MTGVYTITNLLDGKIYIGCSIDIIKRFRDHISLLNLGKHRNRILQNSWNKYGSESFIFEVLNEIDSDLMYSEENYWCNLLNTHNRSFGYNIRSKSEIRICVLK